MLNPIRKNLLNEIEWISNIETAGTGLNSEFLSLEISSFLTGDIKPVLFMYVCIFGSIHFTTSVNFICELQSARM